MRHQTNNRQRYQENLYDILGVLPTATQKQIRAAYRRLAFHYHPDRNPTGREKFQKIQEAYDVLRDPRTRRKYDSELEKGSSTPDDAFHSVEYTAGSTSVSIGLKKMMRNTRDLLPATSALFAGGVNFGVTLGDQKLVVSLIVASTIGTVGAAAGSTIWELRGGWESKKKYVLSGLFLGMLSVLLYSKLHFPVFCMLLFHVWLPSLLGSQVGLFFGGFGAAFRALSSRIGWATSAFSASLGGGFAGLFLCLLTYRGYGKSPSLLLDSSIPNRFLGEKGLFLFFGSAATGAIVGAIALTWVRYARCLKHDREWSEIN